MLTSNLFVERPCHVIFQTIGDCYVAACGIPTPTNKHAILLARFAQNILVKFRRVAKEVEVSLGPGTSDLGLRVGIASGPVTAGVLRGEKARFQVSPQP